MYEPRLLIPGTLHLTLVVVIIVDQERGESMRESG
jgi:hypothetical protein